MIEIIRLEGTGLKGTLFSVERIVKMKKEFLAFKDNHNQVVQAFLWLPEEEPKKVLQIVHGMTEHMGRYAKLAEILTEAGIAVAGFDLKGHGMNAKEQACASFGEGGWEAELKEIHEFHKTLMHRFPKAKHYMMGFSLGSFLIREYFSLYENSDIEGAIIMGTGQQPAFLLSLIMAIVKGEIKKAGFDNTTKLVRTLSFGTYNRKFRPNRTKADWLCSDEEELRKYISDDLCKEDISSGLFWQLLDAMKRMASVDTYAKWNKNMPVPLISGADDPVGDAGKGVRIVEQAMKKSGLCSVTLKLYPKGRHDVLHEEKSGIASSACKTIKQWLMY